MMMVTYQIDSNIVTKKTVASALATVTGLNERTVANYSMAKIKEAWLSHLDVLPSLSIDGVQVKPVPEPVPEQAQPVKPVLEQAQPVPEQAQPVKPVLEQAQPVPEQAQPVLEQAQPVKPVLEQAQPVGRPVKPIPEPVPEPVVDGTVVVVDGTNYVLVSGRLYPVEQVGAVKPVSKQIQEIWNTVQPCSEVQEYLDALGLQVLLAVPSSTMNWVFDTTGKLFLLKVSATFKDGINIGVEPKTVPQMDKLLHGTSRAGKPYYPKKVVELYDKLHVRWSEYVHDHRVDRETAPQPFLNWIISQL
jgi:hypothetical protein